MEERTEVVDDTRSGKSCTRILAYAAMAVVLVYAVVIACTLYSFEDRYRHSYADNAAVYTWRALKHYRTFAELKEHISRNDLEFSTPASPYSISFSDIQEEDTSGTHDVLAKTGRFFVPKDIPQGTVADKAYSLVYYTLNRDVYTSALPGNLLYGISWGTRGNARTVVLSPPAHEFKAYVLCDKDDKIVAWAVEKPFEDWEPTDRIRTTFDAGDQGEESQ